MHEASSDRKDAGEELGENAEDDKPGSDGDQNVSSPALHGGGPSPESGNDARLSRADHVGDPEDEHHDGDRRKHESEERAREAADYECYSGQTDQDGAGSAEPGEQVAETKDGES